MVTDYLEERSLQALAFLSIGVPVISAAAVWSLGEKLHHQDEERQQ